MLEGVIVDQYLIPSNWKLMIKFVQRSSSEVEINFIKDFHYTLAQLMFTWVENYDDLSLSLWKQQFLNVMMYLICGFLQLLIKHSVH